PDVEETMKWSFPHFMHNGMLCGMAGFKQHCSFGFWKASLIFGDGTSSDNTNDNTMGHFRRLTALSDLPGDKILIGYIKKAVELNDAGIKVPAKPKSKAKKELVVPPFFLAALKKNK